MHEGVAFALALQRSTPIGSTTRIQIEIRTAIAVAIGSRRRRAFRGRQGARPVAGDGAELEAAAVTRWDLSSEEAVGWRRLWGRPVQLRAREALGKCHSYSSIASCSFSKLAAGSHVKKRNE